MMLAGWSSSLMMLMANFHAGCQALYYGQQDDVNVERI